MNGGEVLVPGRWLAMLARIPLILLVATAMALLRPTVALAATFTVNSSGDGGDSNLRDGACNDGTGHCTLRAAIQQANASLAADTISFNVPHRPLTLPVIQPGSALPGITRVVVIDGTTQPAPHEVVIDGTNAGVGTVGLTITAGNSTVRGLLVRTFGLDGILLSTNGGNTIARNTIQGNGNLAAHAGEGVDMSNSSSNVIGGPASTDRNLIIGNAADGVAISGGSANTVEGNFIGTTGSTASGNALDGVIIASSAGNTVGPGNVISGNAHRGVDIFGGPSTGNIVMGNLIGTDSAGNAAVPNAQGGVLISGSPGNTIGGTTGAARNVISGNTVDQVEIIAFAAQGNVVDGNFIGTNASGSSAVTGAPANSEGVVVGGTAANNSLGGTVGGSGNVISGNPSSGVEIRDLNSTGNQILGNRIGTDSTGAVAVANGAGVAIDLGASDNVVGGTAAGAANQISGNSGDGVDVVGGGSTGNQVLGNLVGTDATGTVGLGNGRFGVYVNAPGAVIGGTTAAARNVISGNASAGMELDVGGNVVEGNYVGTDINGSAAIPNGNGAPFTGQGIIVAGSGNTIGGTNPGAGNVVSGNALDGVLVEANQTVAQGNLIGTNAAGAVALPNQGNGIVISGASNTIGGTTAAARNLISGNTEDGVYFTGDGATANVLEGNYIGTDLAGVSAVPNSGGVFIDASNDTIGGAAPGAGNLISGNLGGGITLDQVQASAGPTGNVIQGNMIGTQAGGTAPLGNGGNGISLIDFAVNTSIGGTAPGAGNLISANSRGVVVSGPNTTGTVVQGNFMGTDVTGTSSTGLGNIGPGIRVEDATNTIVGGTAAGSRNILSGNGGEGADIEGAPNTTVEGNFVGTDVTGAFALPNSEDGVVINGGTADVIGGTAPTSRNVISGNGANGVHIMGNATADFVRHNYIGVSATGTAALANGGDGVLIDGTSANTIGGTSGAARNLISGNALNGVEISGATAVNNLVRGNYIGTRRTGTGAVPNGGDGVRIDTSAANNAIGGSGAGAGNTIAFNALNGVSVTSGSGNSVRRNSIFSNNALGIDLAPSGVNPNDPGDADTGPNDLQNYPVISSVVSSGGSTTITGTLNSTANATFILEFFSGNSCDPSGFGEGRTFLWNTTVTTDAGGGAAFSSPFVISVAAGSRVTATATTASGSTSEFSACATST